MISQLVQAPPLPVASSGNTTQPRQKSLPLPPPVACSIDYLQGLVALPVLDIPEFLILFSSLCREEGTIRDCIGKSFGSTKFPHGSTTLNSQRFAWTDTDDHGNVKLWFSIPGSAVKRIDSLTLVRGISAILSPYQFKISRIDLALDDFSKTLTAAYVDDMQSKQRFIGNPKITPIGYADQPGWTRYIGSRRSLVYIRLYDKATESNGLIDAYRLEAEFKGRVANEHWQNIVEIASSCETVAAYIVESVTGSFRIVDDSNVKKSLCNVEPTLKKFLDHCSSKGGFRVPQPRRKSSLDNSMKWVERSVKSTLATIKKALGKHRFRDYLDQLLKDGLAGMSTRQVHMLKLLNRGDDHLTPKPPKLRQARGFQPVPAT